MFKGADDTGEMLDLNAVINKVLASGDHVLVHHSKGNEPAPAADAADAAT